MAEDKVMPMLQPDQPKPKFNLEDLEHTVERCYSLTVEFTKQLPVSNENLKEVNRRLQALLAEISRIKNDLDVIEMPIATAKAITDTIQTEKPELVVCGVQLYEYGKIQGTSLYTTVVKARKIKDILNARFAELQVDHVARILNYPVY